jgi:hypothetical protein
MQRLKIGQLIHSLWTCNGSDESGFADAIFDGRIDALSWYVIGEVDDDDENISSIPLDESAKIDIDRVHCCNLLYASFCEKYMDRNQPVMIGGLTVNWRSRACWVRPDGSPDMDYISENFGTCTAPVFEQSCSGFTVARPVLKEMSIRDYAMWWNEHHRREQENGSNSDVPLLYLKDWKFTASFPHYDAYEWPHFFQDDWLNQAMDTGYKYVIRFRIM